MPSRGLIHTSKCLVAPCYVGECAFPVVAVWSCFGSGAVMDTACCYEGS
jgi:hypothetical protein